MSKLLAFWNFLGARFSIAGSVARLLIYGLLLFLP
jgi:hypothetical protein